MLVESTKSLLLREEHPHVSDEVALNMRGWDAHIAFKQNGGGVGVTYETAFEETPGAAAAFFPAAVEDADAAAAAATDAAIAAARVRAGITAALEAHTDFAYVCATDAFDANAERTARRAAAAAEGAANNCLDREFPTD